MDELVSKIRSVLISSKGKSDLRTLRRDFRMLMGEEIPFRKFGYNNLEEFIKKVPTLNVSQTANGEILVEATTVNSSKHMVQLISKQKTAKKKNGGPVRLPPHRQLKSTFIPRFERQQEPKTNQQWRAPFVNKSRPRPHVHQLVVSVTNDSSNSTKTAIQQRLVRSVNSPPPPLANSSPAETSARKNPRLTRSVSNPASNNTSNGTQQEQQTSPILQPVQSIASSSTILGSPLIQTSSRLRAPIISDTRQRMRSNNNFVAVACPSSPLPQLPGRSISGPRHPAPTLSKSDIDKLMREGSGDANNVSRRWSATEDTHSLYQPTIPQDKTSDEFSLSRRHSEETVSSPLSKLKAFAKDHALGEVYIRVFPRAKKNNTQQLFDCSIKVDNQSFSSYPTDCSSASEAETKAATKALTVLTTRYSANEKNRRLLLATEQDVLTRLPPIIECHFSGVWDWQVAMDYEEMYEEQLPPNWLALLDTLPTISVEPALHNKHVLKFCKTGEKNINKQPNSNFISNQHLSSDVSVPSNKIHLTEEGWTVQVTYVASTIEVWCRIVDTENANRYYENTKLMQTFYDSIGGDGRATNVATGGFYVVPFDNCWSRVRVLETRQHDVTCFFIDFGDEQIVPRSDMYVLQRQFAKDQAQAFVCRLSGLEELANMKAAQNRLEQISRNTYLAKPQIHEAMEIPDGPEAISIILYDCEISDSGEDDHQETDLDVNHRLLRQITRDSVPSLDPNNINRVYITHATDKGDVYVQPHCEAFGKINELISSLNNIDFDSELPGPHIPPTGSPQATPEDDYQRLYLTRWTNDGNFYRTRVCDRSPCGQYAQLFFIDFGNTEIVNMANPGSTYALNKISEVLEKFPPLAVKVKLDVELRVDPRTGEEAGFGNKILQLMPSEICVLLKIVRTVIDDEGNRIPICEMFRRSDSHNDLFSISASLKYGHDRRDDTDESSEEHNNNDKTVQLAKKLERLKTVSSYPDTKPVPSTGELKIPTLPATGECFDVTIPFAVNPWNFFVQPYESAKDFRKMMEQLQNHYNGVFRNYLERVQLANVIPGKIYVSKHTDGVWYRTCVIKIINSGSLSVYLCDVGYYANITVEQLFPMDPAYLKLPAQALKARLDGIKPRDAKWSMDDCLHFESLVRGKSFVSVIEAVQQDELYICDPVLILKLIDTSASEDIYIDKLLIEKKIAASD